MLNLLGAIFSGLIVGVLARYFYPGVVAMGMLMTILLGIGGSVLASVIAGAMSGEDYRSGVHRAGCLASILGAMALIFIGRHLF
ncbi:GlsB/YeaQ/YmgE family stress response membrane protein [Novosphingobium flavum]|uniref:GlsB/YeaQ/YmgE family stress response membrane protein n=1 Tax=Novosphingobium flavum TaxID=1778672 RepID=A0A7X1FVB1_9SPHN|nr:GlsB/YeaQ/YmgE family stress response membrane protein [Novosphingobium flavum]MBC2667067.1 GlsB/YeaQ/YmgE family stress response membrane protein [Novosphingobium flavum]